MPKLTYENYGKLPFVEYYTLEEKMNALFNGEVLYVKNLDRKAGDILLAKLERKKYDVTHIASDINNPDWVLYNIGINDLSLSCVFKFEQDLFAHKNKFMVNDVVQFAEGSPRVGESVIIEGVYESHTYPGRYAYKLNGAYMLYAEHELDYNE